MRSRKSLLRKIEDAAAVAAFVIGGAALVAVLFVQAMYCYYKPYF